MYAGLIYEGFLIQKKVGIWIFPRKIPMNLLWIVHEIFAVLSTLLQKLDVREIQYALKKGRHD